MQERELINAVNQIELDQDTYKRMYQALKDEEQTISRKRKPGYYIVAKYAAAAILLAVVGISLSFPVKALVGSFAKARMEALPEEFLTEEMEKLDTQEKEAYEFSREYTNQEIERMAKLYEQYHAEGLFPEKELPRVANESEAEGLELCFVYQDGLFKLPERELTDEELLELIDYNETMQYVVEQNYEALYADEIAKQKEEETKNKKVIHENGGISEYRAIELATQKLWDIYELEPGSMEQNAYLEVAEENVMNNRDSYCVNWADIIHHQYYYFFIDANNGEIYQIFYSSGEVVDAPVLTEDKLKEVFPDFILQAKEFLQEKMEISGEFSAKGYIRYRIQRDGTVSTESQIGIVELIDQVAGEAYMFSFIADGTILDYSHMNAEEYQEYLEEFKTMHTSAVLLDD